MKLKNNRICLKFAFLLLVTGAVSFGQELNVQISNEEVAAPIYVLNGEAETTFLVDGDIDVVGSFVFSMDDAASPNVIALGDYAVTSWDWDADLEASSTYKISSYGNLIRVAFRHLAGGKPGGRLLMGGVECQTGQILSQGSMVLVQSDPYFLSGGMSGYVRGFVGGRIFKWCNYRNVPFTQAVDVVSSDWGAWDGNWDLTVSGTRVSGNGTIRIGPDSDPVESLSQTARGTFKNGIYSWSAAGAGANRKVQVKITHNSTVLVDKKNSISAVAQTRKF